MSPPGATMYADDTATTAAVASPPRKPLNSRNTVKRKRVSSIGKKKSKTTGKNPSSSTGERKAGLTRGEEIRYSFAIRTFRAAVRLRDQLARGNCISSNDGQSSVAVDAQLHQPTEQEWADACGCTSIMELRRIMHEGQLAREALVSANVGLVTSIAKKHYQSLKYAMEAGGGLGSVLSLDDLVQEGNLGLMEAAERYEPEKGFRFSTYATWWIRQRILRSISDSSRTIRLPAHVHTTLSRIQKTKTEMKHLNGREPSLPELAHELEMPVEKLRLYTDSSRNVVSLELPLRTASTKEDRRTIGDVLASDAPTPEEDVEIQSLRNDIRSVLETELADRERDVLMYRFGFAQDGKSRTVEETAQQLGISRDRVRHVEARALNKLRSPRRNYRLKEYVAAAATASAGSDRHNNKRTNIGGDRSSGYFGNSFDAEHGLTTTATQSTATKVFADEDLIAGGGSSDRRWFF